MKEKATIFDYVRICKNHKHCNNCLLSSYANGMNVACITLIREYPDKANEIILNWCKEHPVETRQDRFLKMFPNAQKLDTDILSICPKTFDVTLDINCARPCSGCYKDYWLAEVKENE